jgi:hypothetical protein
MLLGANVTPPIRSMLSVESKQTEQKVEMYGKIQGGAFIFQ